jgi:holliday junction DNA helicase RuvA
MIATLRGVVTSTGQPLTVEVGGVGYGLFMSEDDRLSIPEGEEKLFYVYEHIQEKAHDLYGFSTPEAKRLFVFLTSINGIGPKAGLAILDLGSTSTVKQNIAAGNATYISGASGVGKKTAERVIVELKDKLTDEVLIERADGNVHSVSAADDEAVEALVVLGYNQQQAVKALSSASGDTTEERIKAALKDLGS